MYNINRIYIFIVFILVPLFVNAQTSSKYEPRWMIELPEPQNNTFVYETYQAVSSTIESARNECLQELISKSEMKNGMLVYSDKSLNMSVEQSVKNNSFDEIVNIKGNFNTDIKTNEVKLYVNKIDEYWEIDKNGKYILTTLYAKSELKSSPLFDDIELTSSYGVKGLWRSAIVPGWGQFYKRSYLKGGLILGGSVLLVGGIVYTECMRADYWKKQRNGYANGTEQIQFYYQKEKNFAIARNVCIGGLCALYVYNLIDAIVAPGARYVKVSKTDHNGNVYTLAPTINYDGSPMLAGSIRF